MTEYLYPYLELEAEFTLHFGGVASDPRAIMWQWTTAMLSVSNLGNKSTSQCLLVVYTANTSGDLTWSDYTPEGYVILYLQPGEKTEIPLSDLPINLNRGNTPPIQSIAVVYDAIYDPLPAGIVDPQDRKIEALPKEAFMGKRPIVKVLPRRWPLWLPHRP